jgi:flagellar basal-body rod protein FlgF
MTISIYEAAAGAMNQQLRMEILANNLANINTAGFKEDKAVFRAYLPQEARTILVEPAAAATAVEEAVSEGTGSEIGEPFMTISTGMPSNYIVTLDGTATNFNEGIPMKTGNPLNFALQGSGFFCVQTPGGTQYTRNGSFTVNEQGLLSTQDGFPVLGTGGTITIDKENFTVDAAGNICTVNAEGGEYRADNSVGQLKVVDFDEPDVLIKAGNGLFDLKDLAIGEKPAENCEVRQGYVEGSNVNPVGTMTEMIEVLRTYESYQKVIQALDDINDKATTDIARIA